MTEQQIPSSVTGPRARGGPSSPEAPSRAWTGWVRFGGIVMTVIGAFAIVEGLYALFSPTFVSLTQEGVLLLDLTAWGWLHLLMGVLVLATGLSLAGSAPNWARGAGIVLVSLNMIVQLAFLPAYPIWSILMIGLGLVVIYALMITWDDVAG
ncbi:hypothetical protein ACFPK1_32630 [Actinomycetospora rhizophila]|uniref:DUF7144 domain-containing protein n=1 Tax=Actinomycetospora rhizophila TaxID=1416876 RepID=A0ABV9ZS09_9PSEU